MKTIFAHIASVVIACLSFGHAPCLAQNRNLFSMQENDSVHFFSITEFYDLVLRNHPVAKQAQLLSELSRQELRMARGNFDPKIEASFQTKESGGKEYYRIANGALKFPSVLPVDPVIGLEQNRGPYLNPERYISDQYNNRQLYAGVSMPLLRGLITDDRRAALRQAELFGELMQAEQIKTINKLLLDAAKDYWNWTFTYYNYQLYDRAVTIASEVFRRVKLNHELGEAAVIDTVQAKITLQQRLVERQEAYLDFQNSGLVLSNYLWDSLANPLAVPASAIPRLEQDLVGISKGELEELVSQARSSHPELQKIEVKIDQLEVTRRLAQEQLKPKLDLSYYLLNQPFNPMLESSSITGENYKLGVDFSFPLFLRKESGKLAQTKTKIASAKFEQSLAEREIVNQITAAYNQLTNSGNIIVMQTEMVENYERLLSAELLNLTNGESDLFKINIQQEKLLTSQSKLLKVLSEYQKQRAFLYWAAGINRVASQSDRKD